MTTFYFYPTNINELDFPDICDFKLALSQSQLSYFKQIMMNENETIDMVDDEGYKITFYTKPGNNMGQRNWYYIRYYNNTYYDRGIIMDN